MTEPSYIDQAAEAVHALNMGLSSAEARMVAEAAIGALPMKKRPFSSSHSEAEIAGQLKEIGVLSAKITAMNFGGVVPAGHEPFVGHVMLWPHEVAEQIAKAIEPSRLNRAGGAQLQWAAQVARKMFPRPKP